MEVCIGAPTGKECDSNAWFDCKLKVSSCLDGLYKVLRRGRRRLCILGASAGEQAPTSTEVRIFPSQL